MSIRLGAWPIEVGISFLKASKASEIVLYELFRIETRDGVIRFTIVIGDFFGFFDNEHLLTPYYLVILGTKLDSTLYIKLAL